ncbi:phage tail protein, partial [Kluyvera sp. Nf5]
KVILREPSGDAWVKFREFLTPPELPEGEEPAKLTSAQEFIRNKEADTILFVDVLRDEAGERVFSDDDIGTVAEVYGQVHKRLLNMALALGVDQEQAEKK